MGISGHLRARPTPSQNRQVGHVGDSVKTAFHGCQWVILGVCRGGRPMCLGGVPATLWGTFRSRSTAVGRDLPRFGALFAPGPPPLAVCLLRFGAFFVAGPPRWGGTCHGLVLFSRLVHHPWWCACYVLGVFRSRSTAVGRDLPRLSALFVPGPPREKAAAVNCDLNSRESAR